MGKPCFNYTFLLGGYYDNLVDVKQQKKYRVFLFQYLTFNPYLYCYTFNEDKKLNITPEQWEYLVLNSDHTLAEQDNGNQNLMSILNKTQLPFNQKLVEHIIYNSNLKHFDLQGDNALIYFLRYKVNNKFNFDEKLLDYFIKNSDLTRRGIEKISMLERILNHPIYEKISFDTLNYVSQNCDLDKADLLNPKIKEFLKYRDFVLTKREKDILEQSISNINIDIKKQDTFKI